MDKKPIKPKAHGVIDYGFSSIQLAVPTAIGMNDKACKTYQALGAGFLVVNALTDTPAGIKPVIPFKYHQKADAAFLAGLSLLTFSKPIRKSRRALFFHLGFLSVAIAHYVLTDYEEKPKSLYQKIVSKISGY